MAEDSTRRSRRSDLDDERECECANLREAKKAALLDSCVLKTVDDKGRLKDIRRFPFASLSAHRSLGLYGCPVAVRLLLVLQQEGILALALCFLVCLPCVVDNMRRSVIRSQCRSDGGGVACGPWTSLLLREPDRMPKQPFYLWATIGSCEEYTNSSIDVQPVYSREYPLRATREAAFCIKAYHEQHYELWAGVLVTAILVLFLCQLRRLQTRIVADQDEQLWSATDYAVLLTGLRRGELPAEQERSLRSDLCKLGIGEEAVSHIEVGCGCKREHITLVRIAKLRVQAQELQARVSDERAANARVGSRARSRASPLKSSSTGDSASMQGRLAQIQLELRRARDELEEVREEAHLTTGQVRRNDHRSDAMPCGLTRSAAPSTMETCQDPGPNAGLGSRPLLRPSSSFSMRRSATISSVASIQSTLHDVRCCSAACECFACESPLRLRTSFYSSCNVLTRVVL